MHALNIITCMCFTDLSFIVSLTGISDYCQAVLLDFKRFLACTSRCPGDGAAEREEVENKEVEARNSPDLTHWVQISSFVAGVRERVSVFPRIFIAFLVAVSVRPRL